MEKEVLKINVAIMGAGLAGLAAAITLEENGINPSIYEKRSQVGDRFFNCELLLSVLSKPIDDAIKYFAEEHKIFLQPQSNIRKLIIHSENNSAEITGHLGFTNLRGRAENSFEKQLEKQVNSKIHFNSQKSYEELLHAYSHVILATGDATYATKITEYDVDLTVTLKGAIIDGNFDIDTVEAWLNHKFAPLGYSYLIPITQQKANIVIAYPDYPENQKYDINKLWENFLDEIAVIIGQNFKMKRDFEVTRYIIGKSKYPRIGNTFLVGNNFGSIMPFLGFGQVASLLTGIYAAHDICGLGDYTELTSKLVSSYHESLTLRRTLEKLDNAKLDILVKGLKGKVGQKVFNGEFNYLKLISKLLP